MKKLYVLVRSDLASMTPGKAAAQVAHAASQAARVLANDPAYIHWENDPSEYIRGSNTPYPMHAYSGFGTTIVLDGGSGEQLESLYFTQLQPHHSNQSGIVADPSYPIDDGLHTFTVNTITCVWVFFDSENGDRLIENIISRYGLYNGNRM